MNSPRLVLKQPSGWFAAGQQMAQALSLLSDGTFKLFVYLCLAADRATGQLLCRQAELARQLGKSPRSITAYLEELRQRGVCHVTSAANQHQAGSIEIADAFWPYRKLTPAAANDAEPRYVEQVRSLFLSQSCVASAFGAADRKLAASWFRQNVPIEQVQRAYRLGCTRKYVALCNHPRGTPITCLSYFTNLLEEVTQSKIAPDYGRHLECRLRRLETQWQQAKTTQPSAYTNFAQANPRPQGKTK